MPIEQDHYPFDDTFPFAGKQTRSTEFDPVSGNWTNYGDLFTGEHGTLYLNNNYTGTPVVNNASVQSIAAGPFGARGLREASLSGPGYNGSVGIGAYSGPALYFGGGKRLIADGTAFADFGSHSVVVLAGARIGPNSASVFNKGGGADASGTVFCNSNEIRIFNSIDQGTGQFIGPSYGIQLLSYTYDHSTGVHRLWRNGVQIYSGTGPGSNGGRLFVLGQGAGGFSCADFYLMKWAFKTGVMSEDLRLAQEAHFAV